MIDSGVAATLYVEDVDVGQADQTKGRHAKCLVPGRSKAAEMH